MYLKPAIMSKREKREEYDSEPIMFCAKCFSLKIKHEDAVDMDYCCDCGCSYIKEASIQEWESLYERKYGHKYVVKSKDPRRNPVFRLTRKELINRLCNLPQWRDVIRSLYPHFPQGYSKIDSVVLLFDKLTKDNRMDDLRLKLMDYING